MMAPLGNLNWGFHDVVPAEGLPVPYDDITAYRIGGSVLSPAERSCAASHLPMMVQFLESDDDYLMAVEDDVVSGLAVVRAHRQGGLGRALLEDAMARNTSLRLWTFQANTGAQRFYLRAGFTEAQRTDGADNEEKLPDIEYVWHAGGRP